MTFLQRIGELFVAPASELSSDPLRERSFERVQGWAPDPLRERSSAPRAGRLTSRQPETVPNLTRNRKHPTVEVEAIGQKQRTSSELNTIWMPPIVVAPSTAGRASMVSGLVSGSSLVPKRPQRAPQAPSVGDIENSEGDRPGLSKIEHSGGGSPEQSAGGDPPTAAVFGTRSSALPVAAACAAELRGRAKSPAALVCIWKPGAPDQESEPEPQSAVATQGARGLASRLSDRGVPAVARGRLAWTKLVDEPDSAAVVIGQAVRTAGDAPVVVAVAGPRPAELERALVGIKVAIAVLARDAPAGIGDLALGSCSVQVKFTVEPLASGPPRWRALAGMGRMRALPELWL